MRSVAGYWLLVTGYWMLVTGCGCWLRSGIAEAGIFCVPSADTEADLFFYCPR